MTRKEKLQKFNKKYGINVIAESNGRIIYELNGYIHDVIKAGISKIKLDSPYSMTTKSYLDYLNNTVFSNTPLEAIDVIDNYITYVNHETNECAKTYKHNIDVNSMINITSKICKYREAIIKIHGDKYIYDECWPESATEKTILECPIHGKFSATVSNILSHKCGCPYCANELKGYTRTKFIESCIKNNNGNGTLYLAKVSDDKEEFLKIGITSYANTDNRFKELKSLYQNVTPLIEINSDPTKVYNLEKYIHRNFIPFKYLPLKVFGGHQECYNIKAIDSLINIICKRL